MLRVGLTGGIGTGKSVVSDKFIELYNTPVIDADEISRTLMKPGQPAYEEARALFGEEIVSSNGEINRGYLRALIFSDEEKRAQLEKIIHPKVRDEISNRIATLSGPYCLIVIPLLVEANMQSMVDRILVVDSDPSLQIKRVKLRDNCEESQIKEIINSQIDRQERLLHADDIIINDGNLHDLELQIRKLHEKYLALSI